MLKPIKDSDILKRYSSPPGGPTNDDNPSPSGSISVFPNSPLDLPSETFESALKRREKNHQTLNSVDKKESSSRCALWPCTRF